MTAPREIRMAAEATLASMTLKGMRVRYFQRNTPFSQTSRVGGNFQTLKSMKQFIFQMKIN